jgi:hypothetical protein
MKALIGFCPQQEKKQPSSKYWPVISDHTWSILGSALFRECANAGMMVFWANETKSPGRRTEKQKDCNE